MQKPFWRKIPNFIIFVNLLISVVNFQPNCMPFLLGLISTLLSVPSLFPMITKAIAIYLFHFAGKVARLQQTSAVFGGGLALFAQAAMGSDW